MRSLFLGVAMLAVFVVPLSGESPAVRLWVVSDGVRVSATTGQVIEARTDIHADYPRADFRSANSVWRAANKTVSLKAARNEFVAFQVIVEASAPVEVVDVKFSGLTGPGGAQLTGKYAAIFKEWYVHVRQATTGYERSSLGPGWYPDALMPYRHARLYSAFPFSIPDRYNDIPGQTNQGLWVDLFVPDDRGAAPPGRYTGEFEVTWKGATTVFASRSTYGTSLCLRRITSPEISGMIRCGTWHPKKRWRITNWHASTASCH